MTDITTVGHIKDGVLTILKREEFAQAIKSQRDGPVIVSVKRKREKRSQSQLGYYFAVFVPLITDAINDAFGETIVNEESTHEYMKHLHNSKRVVTEEGEELTIAQSTANMTTTEYMEFMERVRHWASLTFNLTIPEPLPEDLRQEVKPRKRRDNNNIFVEDGL